MNPELSVSWIFEFRTSNEQRSTNFEIGAQGRTRTDTACATNT